MAGISLLILCSCGNSRTPLPSLSASAAPAAPGGFHTLLLKAAGIALAAPNTWTVTNQKPPLVVTISSGQAVVAVWRYRRRKRLPSTRRQLVRARLALIARIRTLEPAVEVVRSRVLRLDHSPAIELDALERIGSGLRRVRSTHLFTHGTEVVVEEYAPPSLFHTVDHEVFSPLRHSLVVLAS